MARRSLYTRVFHFLKFFEFSWRHTFFPCFQPRLVQWYQWFVNQKHFRGREKLPKIMNYNGKSKNIFFEIFILGSTTCATMRGFQTWSQNWIWIILTHVFAEKPSKTVEIVILPDFDGFSAKTWVKYYPNSTLRPDLESSHHGAYFRPQNERNFENLFFDFPQFDLQLP